MKDLLILADASRVTPAEFFHTIFPKPNQQHKAERDQALRDHQAAMQASYKLPKLWDGIERRKQLVAEHEARLREIDARYAEQLAPVSRDTAPDNGNPRIAA